MPSRKAGEMLQQLLLPNVQKPVTASSPYFYGMDERGWRSYMNEYHDYIKKGGASKQTVVEGIEDDLRITPGEANDFYNFSRNPSNTVARHVALGVPHAYSSEDLIKSAMSASGRPTAFNNADSHFATDLQTMVGKLRQQVDVQNQFKSNRYPNELEGIAALNNLRDRVGQTMFEEAGAKDTLDTIFNRAADKSGQFNLDKLLQSRGLARPDEVKDALVGGIYNQDLIQNLAARQNQGYYDVTRPLDIVETDLGKLRSALLPMTKREFVQMGGDVIDSPRFKSKLHIQVPTERMREMATPDVPYISDVIRQEIIQRGGN